MITPLARGQLLLQGGGRHASPPALGEPTRRHRASEHSRNPSHWLGGPPALLLLLASGRGLCRGATAGLQAARHGHGDDPNRWLGHERKDAVTRLPIQGEPCKGYGVYPQR